MLYLLSLFVRDIFGFYILYLSPINLLLILTLLTFYNSILLTITIFNTNQTEFILFPYHLHTHTFSIN